jgi:hypothetical protein
MEWASSTISKAVASTWTVDTKAWEIYGDIGIKWHETGAELGFLGYLTLYEHR